MSSTKITLSALACLLLQLLVARYLQFGSFDFDYLDLVLVVTVYSSFGRDPLRAMLVGAGSGLVQDGFSGAILGTQSLIKTLVGFLIGSLSIRVALDNLFPRLIVMLAASVVNLLLFVGLHRLFGRQLIEHPVWETLARHLVWHVAANLAAALLVFHVLDRLMKGESQPRDRYSVQGRFR